MLKACFIYKEQSVKDAKVCCIYCFVCQSLKQGATHRPTSQSLHQYELSFLILFLRHWAQTLSGLALFSVGGQYSGKCRPISRNGFSESRGGLRVVAGLSGAYLEMSFSLSDKINSRRGTFPPRALYVM